MSEFPRPGRDPLSPAIVTAVVLAALASLRLGLLASPSAREYDEGVYLLSARAHTAGHALFTSVFSSQPPALLESLSWCFRLAGDSLATGRALILAFALVALLAAGDVARLLVSGVVGRRAAAWAAPSAAAALALSTTFFDLSHLVVAEIPALALALASFAVLLRARELGWSAARLAGAGALFALALLFKILVLPMALPLLLLLLDNTAGAADADENATASPQAIGDDVRGLDVASLAGRRGPGARMGWLVLGAALVLLPALAAYDQRALVEQTVAFHLAKQQTYRLSPGANLHRIVAQLHPHAAIALSALGGLVLLASRSPAASLWLGSWLAAACLALVFQAPLFWRHVVLLSAPLAIAAGALPALLGAGLRARARLAVTAAAIAIWSLPLLRTPGLADKEGSPTRRSAGHASAADAELSETAARIRALTGEQDVVGGDDPLAVYLAGRQAPPGLCDTSHARIASGFLSLEQATHLSADAALLVLQRRGRLSRLPGYTAWVEENYSLLPDPASPSSARLWLRNDPRHQSTGQADSRSPPPTGSAAGHQPQRHEREHGAETDQVIPADRAGKVALDGR